MHLYFLCLSLAIYIYMGFCLTGPVYSSYLRFINTAKTRGQIECNMDSYIVTNHSQQMKNCNGKKNCWIPSYIGTLFYVCVKMSYQKSTCTELRSYNYNLQSGCYVRKGIYNFQIGLLTYKPNEIYHVFLLQSSIYRQYETYRPFSYFTCKGNCYIHLRPDAWFLLILSYNDNEDFGKFFVDINQQTTAERKIESTKYTTTMAPTKSSFKVDKSTKYPTTMAPTEGTSSVNKGTNYPTTMAPIEGTSSVNKVLVALVVILLIVTVLMSLAFYRERLLNSKMTPNAKLTNANNEFPLSGNVTINPGSHENTNTTENHEFNRNVESEVQPQQQFAQMPEAVYAGINQGEGLTNDAVTGGPRHVVRDSYSATGGPRHGVVNGELYATVNKEEESIYVNYFRPDYLIREEVNGEMYTLVEKRRDK